MEFDLVIDNNFYLLFKLKTGDMFTACSASASDDIL